MRFHAGIGLVLAALVAGRALAGADTNLDAGLLQERNRALGRLVDLAKIGKPYLVLDVVGSRLRLMQGGAVLREYAVRAAEIGVPSTVFVDANGSADVLSRLEGAVHLDPERVYQRPEKQAPAPGSVPAEDATAPGGAVAEIAADTYIPPTPEEAIPAPGRYFLRIEGGLSVEVTGQPALEQGLWHRIGSAVGRKWRAVRDAVGGVGPRLRLTLDDAEAAALYRSLPDGVTLTIL